MGETKQFPPRLQFRDGSHAENYIRQRVSHEVVKPEIERFATKLFRLFGVRNG